MTQKEAIKILKDFHDKSALFSVRTALETLHPELKESEDEKIRKSLVEIFKLIKEKKKPVVNEENANLILAWLEKQGEQKPVEEANVDDYGIDSLWHAQTILEKTLGTVDGYETDDGILEHKCAISAVKKLRKQKPAWSEEDENCLSIIIAEFSKRSGKSVSKDEWMRCNDFLNSLKDKVQLKREWTEEDEKFFKTALWHISYSITNGENTDCKCDTTEWLKHLKERIKGE